MELWSAIFISDDSDWATCSVTSHTWRQITDDNPDAQRIIARVEFDSKTIYVPLGAPVAHDSHGSLFLPKWAISNLGIDGTGEIGEVTWLPQDAFPSASRIVLRPHDSAFHTVDAKEELEIALTRLGVLRSGDTLVIPIGGLGGYEIAFDVMVTEPADVVLAEGDEVVMEFEQALDAPAAPVPSASEPTAPEEFVPDQMIETPPLGHTLGGQPTRRMADGRAWNPWRVA
jgi:hypothetical protein